MTAGGCTGTLSLLALGGRGIMLAALTDALRGRLASTVYGFPMVGSALGFAIVGFEGAKKYGWCRRGGREEGEVNRSWRGLRGGAEVLVIFALGLAEGGDPDQCALVWVSKSLGGEG